MAVAYRQPMDGRDEFPLLIDTWAEVCGGIRDEDFSSACRLHLSRSRFFPCPADILSAAEECRPARAQYALPETPEHKTIGLGKAVRAALSGDVGAREYVEALRRQRQVMQ